jgi:hypothetical protein
MRKNSYNEVIKKEDEILNSMTIHFQSMFDGNFIKHFEIRYEGTCDLGSQEIIDKYGLSIQKELIPWIYREYKENRLFNKTNWKLFHDKYNYSFIFLGYKILFNFEKYYFQLGIEEECDTNNCKYCQNNENELHFQLIICGWKENENDIFLKPYTNFPILPNNIMPELYWKRK